MALIQSLVRKGEVSDLVAGYGHLVVDECHHLSAASFELVARRSKARYVLGLSADDSVSRLSVPAIGARLAQDGHRNAVIIDDVAAAFAAGRTPLVLTERRDHLETLKHAFEQFTQRLVVLHGGMKPGERRDAAELLHSSDTTPRIILATGRYLGEGFDDPRLDALFITMPIAWKGTLAQYVGRLHRDHHGKNDVVVYDYADTAVPVLARMVAKRKAGYRALGYRLP